MNMDANQAKDFLAKAEEIEALVKTFRSGNENDVEKAMSRADELIADVNKTKKQFKQDLAEDADGDDEDLPQTRTGFSKTSINKVTEDVPGKDDVNYAGMSQEGFMQAIEADAKERAQRRKERMKLAEEFKEKGNIEFRAGNFVAAEEFYTQGLREIKDNTALYTNRAQTYIKLGKYPEALLDCEWALKVFPNCMKAHIHMGRAHVGMKEYKEARECFQRALTCDPKKEALINDYMAEVDRKELCDKQEAASEEIIKGDKAEDLGVVEVLSRVQKPDQLPVFYSGGFRILKSLMIEVSDKTLFRTKGGIELIQTLPMLHKCLSASPKSLSGEELDMVASAFEMYAEACNNMDANTEALLQTEGFPQYCTRFLEVKMKGHGRVVKHAITHCLYTLSQLDIGRKHIVNLFNIPKLLAVMFNLIRTSTKSATAAANLLNNLALDKKFKCELREGITETVCPAFEQLLGEERASEEIPRCVSMVTNLTGDKVIRTKLIERKQLWDAVTKAFYLHSENATNNLCVSISESLLGLLLNLTSDPSSQVSTYGPSLCEKCGAMLKSPDCPENLQIRYISLLSHILPMCSAAVGKVVENGGTDILLEVVKGDESIKMKAALKALTAVTKDSAEARQYVVDNKGLGRLLKGLHSEDEIIVGNSALCLSHCTQVPKVCTSLTKTDIMKDLLVLARDGKRPAVQSNCAILIAKLTYGDNKHLERLRELHGIEILHSCMKFIK